MRSMNIRKISVKNAMKYRCVIMTGRDVCMPDFWMNVEKRKATPQEQPKENKETITLRMRWFLNMEFRERS